ncbi:MAG: hypothetical protein R8L07_03470 [Alphaproteobacteria bacterium]|nr:hypothetical protein [Alphaproteobacteria bacterium]
MRAICLIRDLPAYRRDAFAAGLQAIGARVRFDEAPPYGPDDVAVIWNRYGRAADLAWQVEQAGGRVLVCENGYLGREWRGGIWYAIALDQHNGGGRWFPGGPERWDSWKVDPAPWRDDEAGDLVFLPQRGIGVPPTAMPADFEKRLRGEIVGLGVIRVRPHPGEGPSRPLEEDLARARIVLTWGSGAALKALMMGIPVAYWFDRWIGGPAARPGRNGVDRPLRDDAARLSMFRRLAWAMWELEEVASGEPFRHLLLRQGRTG